MRLLRTAVAAGSILCFARCSGGGGIAPATSTVGPSTPATTSASPAPRSSQRWSPTRADTFQWQLTGTFDPSVAATVYDIDAFDTPATTVASLHAGGRHVVCYVNVGAYESWRPDAASFPLAVVGAPYVGWPGESWLDIRNLAVLGPVMEARFDLCKSKGFDAIEPDNVDGYTNATGFPLAASDQLVYNTFLAGLAHARGLSIALKNDGDQAATLAPSFDFVIAEDCWNRAECMALAPFAAAKKAVFTVEYTDRTTATVFHTSVCPQATAAAMTAVLKNRSLDGWRDVCP